MNFLRFCLVPAAILLISGHCIAGHLLNKQSAENYDQGVVAQRCGNINQAEAYYQKALLMEPDNLRLRKYIYNNRGVIYVLQDELEKAREEFLAALRIDPDYQPAKNNLGLLYERTKSRLESLEYWDEVFSWETMKPKKFEIEEEKIQEFY